ncbi:hypothetical protein [Flavobacterium gelatinilyticum]|uniref:hypothetical protein n=1 Tax=Flavobacterium gelatinilyticum TaxID=3003260 RepID=UPI0024811321|nr:hypothetical protein [Flavobacterium gelatinilyticum]
MGDWFENNQTKSVLLYTFLVAGATWAFYKFTFEEQKIDFYKAQVESSRTESEQHKARIEFLEKENDKLEIILKEFEEWNFTTKDPALFYKTRYEEIANQKNKLDSLSLKQKGPINQPKVIISKKALSFIDAEIYKGKTYINDAENLMIGVNEISVEGLCNFTLNAGEKVNQIFKDVNVGTSYKFGKLKITLSETNYVSSRATFHITKE